MFSLCLTHADTICLGKMCRFYSPMGSGDVCGCLLCETVICCIVCTCEFLPPCLLVHVCLLTCGCCATLNIHVCVFDLVFLTVCVAGVCVILHLHITEATEEICVNYESCKRVFLLCNQAYISLINWTACEHVFMYPNQFLLTNSYF